jgi:ribosomal protein S18 acetylase RimI-like enzyme
VTGRNAARHIRLAFVGEAAAVAALIEHAYRGEDALRSWTTEADFLTGPRSSLAEIKSLIADPQSRFVVAVEGDGTLGACALIRDEEGVAYFGMFGVRPDLQGAGLGREVLAAAEHEARALWGCPAMMMTVISLREELIAYYERRGYRRTGETKPFPFDEHTSATRTDFDLVVLRKDFS